MADDSLTLVFGALADPTRRAILTRLASGEASVKELGAPLEISGPALTKHLKVLERAGLISRSRRAQQRPCRIEARGLAVADDWIAQYREMWEAQLDRLGEYLATITGKPQPLAEQPAPRPPVRTARVRSPAATTATGRSATPPETATAPRRPSTSRRRPHARKARTS
ncbi:MAG: metalloregulator ArsR/SmtB family transcription factor [Kofleriaceae bacterium]